MHLAFSVESFGADFRHRDVAADEERAGVDEGRDGFFEGESVGGRGDFGPPEKLAFAFQERGAVVSGDDDIITTVPDLRDEFAGEVVAVGEAIDWIGSAQIGKSAGDQIGLIAHGFLKLRGECGPADETGADEEIFPVAGWKHSAGRTADGVVGAPGGEDRERRRMRIIALQVAGVCECLADDGVGALGGYFDFALKGFALRVVTRVVDSIIDGRLGRGRRMFAALAGHLREPDQIDPGFFLQRTREQFQDPPRLGFREFSAFSDLVFCGV